MDDLLKVFKFLEDVGTYESRKVACTEVNGLKVSTAYTSDEGFETALIDQNGTHPVERYETREEAENGHRAWVAFAEGNIDTVNKLGGWGLVPDKEYTLKRHGQ